MSNGHSHKDQSSGINWGGIVKGALAVGAVAVGVELMFPGTMKGLWENVSKLGEPAKQLADGQKPEPSGLENFMSGVKNFLGTGIGEVILRVGGMVMAITGISYLLNGSKKSDHEQERAGQYAEARESFQLREDIRKAQAVMMARMQASGHAPAMAAGPQRG